MTPTVHELRNEIRTATGRFEREVSTTFTKEDLAAICDAVNYDIDANSLPSKPQMRAGILYQIGELDDDAPDSTQNPFKKAELVRIADTVRDD
ncbi:hypothetical protein Htur_3990 (plasmid) [Haloterrigena turkmenica DSM 5511]|uniref:Uncharacterized protein n=1 Tax=Haloterrigena turkmenica (strain ATCC 51198 / DSM 5511 / JCM 9101 / NCIMB 13204 / VKM B-1734 / 4k) TaxID=543526 RepID=D2S0E2_HALTV|nr:hypothetical protein [Haloterrigena turkmenica]ADB62839.1 hypothetical protein Htur_3990 [Haloterrigena turkmenica DSM 5511]